jgi:hypothetical protein
MKADARWTLLLPLVLAACGHVLTTSTANRPPTITAFRNPGGDAIVGVTVVTFSAFAIDPDGDPVTCTWDLGDGAQPGLRASRSYQEAGTFRANVTCTDVRGASATGSSTVTARMP